MKWNLFGRRRTSRAKPSGVRLRFEQLERRKMLTTYYVATTGSDSNPGTESQPMASLENVQSVVHPGDTVLLESGTYQWNALWWYTSGASGSPITISSAAGGTAVIDGSNMPSGSYTFGLDVNYVNVTNLAITNSPGDGLDLYHANNCTVENVTVYSCQDSGIKVGDPYDSTMSLTTYDTVENCTVFNNDLENSPTERGPNQIWGAGIGAFGASDIVFNGNSVYQNFGEGVDIICANWCYVQNRRNSARR